LVESVREITKSIRGGISGISPKNNGPKIAVMFSGGIDSTIIARLLDLVLPKEEEIDLINLAFR
jgi:asparagine synthetase B (glutamine-hydrolysing)